MISAHFDIKRDRIWSTLVRSGGICDKNTRFCEILFGKRKKKEIEQSIKFRKIITKKAVLGTRTDGQTDGQSFQPSELGYLVPTVHQNNGKPKRTLAS